MQPRTSLWKFGRIRKFRRTKIPIVLHNFQISVEIGNLNCGASTPSPLPPCPWPDFHQRGRGYVNAQGHEGGAGGGSEGRFGGAREALVVGPATLLRPETKDLGGI